MTELGIKFVLYYPHATTYVVNATQGV